MNVSCISGKLITTKAENNVAVAECCLKAGSNVYDYLSHIVDFFHQIIYDALCLRQLCLLPGELLPGFFVLRFQFLGLCFYSLFTVLLIY